MRVWKSKSQNGKTAMKSTYFDFAFRFFFQKSPLNSWVCRIIVVTIYSFIQNMIEIICLVVQKLQTAHRNMWLYFRTIDDNFEEILIKALMEVSFSGICTRRDQCGKGFNKFEQDLTNLVNYNTNNVPFLLTPHAISFKNFK